LSFVGDLEAVGIVLVVIVLDFSYLNVLSLPAGGEVFTAAILRERENGLYRSDVEVA
jgi:hypothetical protein